MSGNDVLFLMKNKKPAFFHASFYEAEFI